ncbi:RNA polymerase subunit sigma [Nonlabens sp. MIC269]|uniref:sigma-70 family RNA polymerase sigma factor n=1 Tax=Nonlabens sp. MIC269 TaxID=1476901 RepID=UPI00071FB12A|nr:sigma-70 family RNA polymerase sigma factor [Nonlabens sp. MIC269]ALM20314.1 RNA polymerase subunit sigma [Nonlabens sp. MIC269]
MKTETNKDIDFENLPSVELLDYISFKDEFPKEAQEAFVQFCYRFEKDLKRKSEIYCNKYGYNEVVALEIAHCTFARVWKYPTFDKKKSKAKDLDKGILIWMYPILYTQIIKYGEQNSCAEPTEEEDLSLVTSADELLDKFEMPEDAEAKRAVVAKLKTIERALTQLSEKHRIIYFTYRAYRKQGKKVPRTITKLLREKLSLTQKSVNTYYGDAHKHVTNYLDILNGQA